MKLILVKHKFKINDLCSDPFASSDKFKSKNYNLKQKLRILAFKSAYKNMNTCHHKNPSLRPGKVRSPGKVRNFHKMKPALEYVQVGQSFCKNRPTGEF